MKTNDKDDPSVRLAWFGIPAVRLAAAGQLIGGKQMTADDLYSVPKLGPRHVPALLVSYYYVEGFLKNRGLYRYRDWSMDSGAFSAHKSGVKIDLNEYVDKCHLLFETDPSLTEVFALDVIGDPDASYRNTQEMWRQGVPAMPVFHAGEPEDLLAQMARDYPKIAIGGMVATGGISSADQKFSFLEQVFARVWPKRIHGLGCASPRTILGLPFHSTDATNWEIGPCAFGNWQKFGAMSVRGSEQDLRSQVRFYLDLEAKAKIRWRREMEQLAALPDPNPRPGARPARSAPDVRLALNGPRMEAGTTAIAIGGAPKPAAKKATGVMDPKWVDYWAKRRSA